MLALLCDTSKLAHFLTTLVSFSEADLGLLQHYHKALHLGCCSSPRSVSECNNIEHKVPFLVTLPVKAFCEVAVCKSRNDPESRTSWTDPETTLNKRNKAKSPPL